MHLLNISASTSDVLNCIYVFVYLFGEKFGHSKFHSNRYISCSHIASFLCKFRRSNDLVICVFQQNWQHVPLYWVRILFENIFIHYTCTRPKITPLLLCKYCSTWYFPMFSTEQGSAAVVPAMAVTLRCIVPYSSITVPDIFRCFLRNRAAQLWYPLWLLRYSTWYIPMFSTEQGSTAMVPAMAVTLRLLYYSTWYFPKFSTEHGSTAVVPAMAVTLQYLIFPYVFHGTLKYSCGTRYGCYVTVPGIFRCFLQNRGAQPWYPLWLLRYST